MHGSETALVAHAKSKPKPSTFFLEKTVSLSSGRVIRPGPDMDQETSKFVTSTRLLWHAIWSVDAGA